MSRKRALAQQLLPIRVRYNGRLPDGHPDRRFVLHIRDRPCPMPPVADLERAAGLALAPDDVESLNSARTRLVLDLVRPKPVFVSPLKMAAECEQIAQAATTLAELLRRYPRLLAIIPAPSGRPEEARRWCKGIFYGFVPADDGRDGARLRALTCLAHSAKEDADLLREGALPSPGRPPALAFVTFAKRVGSVWNEAGGHGAGSWYDKGSGCWKGRALELALVLVGSLGLDAEALRAPLGRALAERRSS